MSKSWEKLPAGAAIEVATVAAANKGLNDNPAICILLAKLDDSGRQMMNDGRTFLYCFTSSPWPVGIVNIDCPWAAANSFHIAFCCSHPLKA